MVRFFCALCSSVVALMLMCIFSATADAQGMQYLVVPAPAIIPSTTPPNDSPVPPVAELTGSFDCTGMRICGLDHFDPGPMTGEIVMADPATLTAGYCVIEVTQPTSFVIDPDGEGHPGEPALQQFLFCSPGAYGALGTFGMNPTTIVFGNPVEFPEYHDGFLSGNGIYTIEVTLWYVFQHSNENWYKVELDSTTATWTSIIPPGGGGSGAGG